MYSAVSHEQKSHFSFVRVFSERNEWITEYCIFHFFLLAKRIVGFSFGGVRSGGEGERNRNLERGESMHSQQRMHLQI